MLRLHNTDKHLEYCVGQDSLKAAIEIAAKAIDQFDNIHNHQRRNGRLALGKFAKNLALKEQLISRASDFDELISIVQNAKCDKIGELAIYDTAYRIGNYLGILPEKIYLHSGTREGAKALIGRAAGKTYILQTDLPSPFQRPDLTPAEIEDILCIYKKELKKCT